VRVDTSTVMPLLLGFMCYQFVLCFLNTNLSGSRTRPCSDRRAFIGVGSMACSSNVPFARNRYCLVPFSLLFAGLGCERRGRFAGPRDIIVIFLAYALGRSQPDREAANKACGSSLAWSCSGEHSSMYLLTRIIVFSTSCTTTSHAVKRRSPCSRG